MPAGRDEPMYDLCLDTLLHVLDTLEAQIRAVRATISLHQRCASTDDDIEPRVSEVPHQSHQGLTVTPRQLEVITQLGHGLSNRQIARHLGMSEATVKSHLYAAYRKLGVSSRSEAMLAVLKRGEQSPSPPE